jgi:hypothetical protein
MRTDAESLKLAFPEETLAMECNNLRDELKLGLKLQATVSQFKSKAIAKIELNNGYFLILKPDATGYNGANFWFKWNTFQDPETGEDRIFSQMRVVAELHKRTTDDNRSARIISFGIEASSPARAIEKTIAKIAEMQGLRLVALPIIEINK